MPDCGFDAEVYTGVVYNRRCHPRTAFSGPVLVDTRTAWHKARGVDVSAGGIRLKSDHPLSIGSEVEVYFELNRLAVETTATVVHREGDQFGLAFDRERNRPRISSLRPEAA